MKYFPVTILIFYNPCISGLSFIMRIRPIRKQFMYIFCFAFLYLYSKGGVSTVNYYIMIKIMVVDEWKILNKCEINGLAGCWFAF